MTFLFFVGDSKALYKYLSQGSFSYMYLEYMQLDKLVLGNKAPDCADSSNSWRNKNVEL